MNCPSCQKPPSFFRISFTLQGVTFAQSMKGYSRCEHCGQLLRIGNLNVSVIAQTVAGVFSVGLYAVLFEYVARWIGYTGALIAFVPYLIVVGMLVTYVVTVRWCTQLPVNESELTGKTTSS